MKAVLFRLVIIVSILHPCLLQAQGNRSASPKARGASEQSMDDAVLYPDRKLNRSAPVLSPAAPSEAGVDPVRLQRMDDMLQSLVNGGLVPGAAAMIVRDGKVVYHKAFGYANVQKKTPLSTDAIFRIASQTKAITSVAVMMLYEEGKIMLDDPVSKYIPEMAKPVVLKSFEKKDSSYTAEPAKREVTIRDLLTHTSGMGYAQIGSPEANAIFHKARVYAGLGMQPGEVLADAMKRAAKVPLLAQPGEKWIYGLNTDMLGYLVEVVSGMPLDQFFRERLFEPLGMKDTWFYQPEQNHERIADLHTYVGDKLIPVTSYVNLNGGFYPEYPKSKGTYFSGGGGLSSTLKDYAIFLQMLLNEGVYEGRRYLSRASVRMMTMNQIDTLQVGPNKFGLGFGITTEKGSSVLPVSEDSFEWGGAFQTTYWVDPREKLVALVYTQIWGPRRSQLAEKFKVMTYQALE